MGREAEVLDLSLPRVLLSIALVNGYRFVGHEESPQEKLK